MPDIDNMHDDNDKQACQDDMASMEELMTWQRVTNGSLGIGSHEWHEWINDPFCGHLLV